MGAFSLIVVINLLNRKECYLCTWSKTNCLLPNRDKFFSGMDMLKLINVRAVDNLLGVSKIAQIVSSLLCLFCLTFATYRENEKVIDLAMHWRIELFIILSFMSASFSLIFLFVYLSVLYRQYPIH